jgi:DNA-binding MarR family transcriptional regulator
MSGPRLSLDAFLPYRLSVTSNLVSDHIARAYETLFGLRIPEWRLIAVIAEAGDGMTPQMIGERTRMDKVTVSRAATALTGRGLIERRGNPGDKRSHFLALTEAGRTLYAAVAPKTLALETELFSGFSPEELARLTAMLDRIDAAVLAAQ